MVKCQFCGTLYVDEHASKEEEYLTVGAYEKLRELKFDEAIEAFDKIINLYPMSFNAYYGRMQARNKMVFYPNKSGNGRKARFFGKIIPSILEDEDYKLAVQYAPGDVAKTYEENAKKIEKAYTVLSQGIPEDKTDVFVCALNYTKDSPNSKIDSAVAKLREENLSVFFLQELQGKLLECKIFTALKHAKTFVLFANSKVKVTDPEYVHLFDRYNYFTQQKEKSQTSFVVVIDDRVYADKSNFPDDFLTNKTIVDFNSVTFEGDFVSVVKTEIANTLELSKKLQTVDVETIKAEKKQIVDVETVNTVKLGNYKIDNVAPNYENKIKWISLALQNGDFVSAQEAIDEELEKNPNNAEVLFAQFMCDSRSRTAGEFFSSIDHFADKERLQNILQLASKNFAEMIVDNLERLIQNIDDVGCYNEYALFVAQYESPNRAEFVSKLADKAVETLDAGLIEKTEKCFHKDEIDKFLDFYNRLADKTGDDSYHQKVLALDAGNIESNLAMILAKMKTVDEKLTYRNAEEIESVLQYLSEEERSQIIIPVLGEILSVAFFDIRKTEEQLDFYLSYISETSQLVSVLSTVGQKLNEMGFYTQAERYLANAIEKDKQNAKLYWLLIQNKIHCSNENEMISSGVKISKMPEWESVLAYADDKESEKYALVVSKANSNTNSPKPQRFETLDKIMLKEKLGLFLERNSKILLEAQKVHGNIKGVNYYKSQIRPFEVFFEQIAKANDFDAYIKIVNKIYERLRLMHLTLEASISALQIDEKSNGLKAVRMASRSYSLTEEEQKKAEELQKSKIATRKFLYGFLEIAPVALTLLLLILSLASPKLVFDYFNQTFLLVLSVYCGVVAVGNLLFYIFKKKNLNPKWKIAEKFLITLTFVNLILFVCSFFIFPSKITVSNEKDLKRYVSNAQYSNIVLDSDIELSNEWTARKFYGIFDGNGHTISNINIKSGEDIAFFEENSGTIKSLTLVYVEKSYKNVDNFAGVAVTNYGIITNCKISCGGTISISTNENAIIGGICSVMKKGSITSCEVNDFNLNISSNGNAVVGGLVGKTDIEDDLTVVKNNYDSTMTLVLDDAKAVYAGGIVGQSDRSKLDNFNLSRNHAGVWISLKGTASKICVGGLVGEGGCESENNYTTGTIKSEVVVDSATKMYVGGLYGTANTTSLDLYAIKTSYSSVTVDLKSSDSIVYGALIGSLKDMQVTNCFSTADSEIYNNNGSGETLGNANKFNAFDGAIFSKFDEKIWNSNKTLK